MMLARESKAVGSKSIWIRHGLGDHRRSAGQPFLPTHMARGMQASSPRPVQVSIGDIYQAAINRAIQDHELDKLFNPDFYDYQI
jgi:hypothetical protein